MISMASRKFCIVPLCQNNTVETPDKYFFILPLEEVKRNLWLKALGCNVTSFSTKTKRFFCEDHFDLEKDSENFLEMKLMNVKPRLRKDVVPSVFNRSIMENERVGLKRKLSDSLDPEMNALDSLEPGTSKGIPQTGTAFVNLSLVPSVIVPSKNEKIITYKSTSTMDSGSATNEDDDNDYEPQSTNSTDSEKPDDEDREFKNYMLKGTLTAIEKNPKIFLGLPVMSYYLIKMLSNNAAIPTLNILITLKKIKLDDSFTVLGIHFGMTASNIGKIFRKTLVNLAQLLQELIYWPDVQKILLELPIPFRGRYGKVVSIIDCLEVEIERPSDPVHQSLTWSQYKKCNTIKYLLSCTPDGLVSFISNGFGGRASDVLIVENCGYLEKLQPGMAIMADRGFKNLAPLLAEKNCHLIRPPSVSNSTPSSPQEVKESKRIAALRIHVERVIGRLREFKMLLPHSCIDNHHIQLLDYIIIIACGIINFQDTLMKG